jgi:hypothetical protein
VFRRSPHADILELVLKVSLNCSLGPSLSISQHLDRPLRKCCSSVNILVIRMFYLNCVTYGVCNLICLDREFIEVLSQLVHLTLQVLKFIAQVFHIHHQGFLFLIVRRRRLIKDHDDVLRHCSQEIFITLYLLNILVYYS